MISGSPQELGFVPAPEFDRLLNPMRGPREVWLTPEGVLLALPKGCQRVGLLEVHSPLGTTLACVEPPGVDSIWPYKERKASS